MKGSLQSLLREIRQCRLCEAALPRGPRPVLQASTRARILIASQAPGTKVHESGKPFSDASGERLRGWLGIPESVFYDEQRIAIVPMGFCYPGRGKGGDLPPRPECAPAWRARVLSGLSDLELTIVIGRYAMAWHLPDAGTNLTDVVTRWRDYWPAVVPLPHPSPRNTPWLRRNPWFETELVPRLRRRVAAVLDTGSKSGRTP